MTNIAAAGRFAIICTARCSKLQHSEYPVFVYLKMCLAFYYLKSKVWGVRHSLPISLSILFSVVLDYILKFQLQSVGSELFLLFDNLMLAISSTTQTCSLVSVSLNCAADL